MTDFLNRLIKRSNGQAPVIRPVVRSSYGTLPLINRSANEFEETVNFEGVDLQTSQDVQPILQHAPSQAGRLAAVDSPAVANSEVNGLLVKPAIASPMTEQGTRQRTGRQSISASGEDKSLPASERNNTGGEAIPSQRATRQRGIAADAAPAISQMKSHTGNASVQRKSVPNNMDSETVGSQQRSAFARTPGEDMTSKPPRQNNSERGNLMKQAVPLQTKHEQEDITIRHSKASAGRQRTTADAVPPMPQLKLRLTDDSVQRKSGRDAIGGEDRAATTSDRNVTGRELISYKKIASPQRTTNDATLPTPQSNSRAADSSVQRKSIGNTLAPEVVVSRQQSTFASLSAKNDAPTMSERIIIRKETASGKDPVNQRITAADTALAAPQRNSHFIDNSRRESLRNAIAYEPRQNTFEIQEANPEFPRESDLLERGLAQDLVIRGREESLESSRQKNPGRQQFTAENLVKHTPDGLSERTAERVSLGSGGLSSTNIRVTIGRVEIRAVQQQEHQAARPTPAPRRPAVSLDDYLKRRDEEKR